MRATEFTRGREFALALDHGEDFYTALTAFCTEHEVRSAFVPVIIGAFRSARLVGACEPPADLEAPVWAETVVEYTEAQGSGTLAWDPDTGTLAPHIHISTGLKHESAHGRVGHLLGAEVQFINEIHIVEVAHPRLLRRRNPGLYEVPLLGFDT
ncbi:PPC domain-containing DNA-binding protein [Streptomyces sp. NPDC000594]|uniref:PPC domain-containing DNA-binding protein n=1 Tax=Streptomyces sp. NPDC000594 TaxID=3154261 RepID=UPI00332C7A11